ncbi:uncharacterized protein PGTG_15492 [Puccinia graminis f. sp. tritici CRL 75-36-700-3]|uniref:Uncharacterized protein n=1 Tax=Puccinia graminis f. sp. tritici (strain CRL 75-36-700-3 / race SCCL) TaxID=418459 RepID=E3KYC2_PUCGT|nr:uncharacterized protein PGTG_15492 [Puccinia graminis f. sp. tritici CRL 75-36-700-3]EFP89313.1 hypothetical protein PGTG_15492 [Puccinia graminis f. sp. tritici CRL 75-36-700-3]
MEWGHSQEDEPKQTSIIKGIGVKKPCGISPFKSKLGLNICPKVQDGRNRNDPEKLESVGGGSMQTECNRHEDGGEVKVSQNLKNVRKQKDCAVHISLLGGGSVEDESLNGRKLELMGDKLGRLGWSFISRIK